MKEVFWTYGTVRFNFDPKLTDEQIKLMEDLYRIGQHIEDQDTFVKFFNSFFPRIRSSESE